jgi:peptide/nickel transport system permease protein
MLRLTPGDPAAVIAGRRATRQQIEEIRGKLGLDRPLLTQFFVWVGRLLQGDSASRSSTRRPWPS